MKKHYLFDNLYVENKKLLIMTDIHTVIKQNTSF